MAFNTRHRWVIARIGEGFGIDVTEVEDWLRASENLTPLNALLDGTGPRTLLCYNQPPDVFHEVCHITRGTPRLKRHFDTHHTSPSTTNQPTHQDTGEWARSDGEARLFFTTGTSARLRGKAVYFVRDTAEGEAVEMGVANDSSLLYGELSENPLQVLESTLSTVYVPQFEGRGDWGRAPRAHQKEFLSEVERFISGVQTSLKSLGDGIELAKPEKKYDLDALSRAGGRIKDDTVLPHFERTTSCHTHTYTDCVPSHAHPHPPPPHNRLDG